MNDYDLLYKKIEAQDKIINEQALEIARLKEKINDYEEPDDMTLMFMWCDEKSKDKIKNLQQRIDKAIEYIKEHYPTSTINDQDDKYKLLKILGDKE